MTVTGTSSSLLTIAEKRPDVLARVTDSGAARSMASRFASTQWSMPCIRYSASSGSRSAEYDALPATSSNSSLASAPFSVSTDSSLLPFSRMLCAVT